MASVVPIYGNDSDTCFRTFRDHLAGLFGAILGPAAYFKLAATDGKARLSFQRGDVRSVRVRTRGHGDLFFYAMQVLDTVETEEEERRRGQLRLRTISYAYGITTGARYDARPLLRWEFSRGEGVNVGTARHHHHADASLSWGDYGLALKDVHVPCGWVSLESVLRFLICDLGFDPFCEEGWPQVLHNSERKYGHDFDARV